MITVNAQIYPTNEEVFNVIKQAVDNGRSKCIVIGIIDNGKESYYGYGNPIEGKIQQPDEQTIFEIASVTKVFVTTIFADLLLKKHLALDDTVINYLPDTLKFRDKRIYNITLKDLATHTSGLPSLLNKIVALNLTKYYKNFSYADLFTSLEKYKLDYDPGTTFQYSNYNMALLAYIICRVTGMDLEILVNEKICKPFEMFNTAFKLSAVQEQNFATGYNKSGKPMPHWEWDAIAGAGGLRSNAQDMILFLRKLFYEDSTLKNAVNLATTVQFDSTRFPGTKIGLGWFITEGKNSLIVGHGGTTRSFKSMLMYDKINNRGTVVLSNTYRDINDIAEYVYDKEKLVK